MSEFRKVEDIERIRSNYEVLKSAFAYKFEVPEFKWESIKEANDIERILYEINKLIEKMVYVFRYTNTFNLGGMEGLIWVY